MDEETAYYLMLPATLLSVIGCSFVIIIYLVASELRIFAFKLVFWVIFFDLIRVISQSIPMFELEKYSISCDYVGPIVLYSIWSNLIWIFSISVNMYQTICLEIHNVEIYYKYWFWLGFSSSLIPALVPFFTDSYGLVLTMCGFSNDTEAYIYRLAFFYVPAWILVILITFMYVKVNRKLKEMSSSSNECFISIKRLYFFPLILVFCISGITASRIMKFFGYQSVYFDLIVNSIWNLHGFLNSIGYAITTPVIYYLKSIFFKKNSNLLISLT